MLSHSPLEKQNKTKNNNTHTHTQKSGIGIYKDMKSLSGNLVVILFFYCHHVNLHC